MKKLTERDCIDLLPHPLKEQAEKALTVSEGVRFRRLSDFIFSLDWARSEQGACYWWAVYVLICNLENRKQQED